MHEGQQKSGSTPTGKRLGAGDVGGGTLVGIDLKSELLRRGVNVQLALVVFKSQQIAKVQLLGDNPASGKKKKKATLEEREKIKKFAASARHLALILWMVI